MSKKAKKTKKPSARWKDWGSTLRGKDESLSGWWGSRVGGFGGWFKGESKGELVAALAAVRRIGRIVYGRDVEFRWNWLGVHGQNTEVILDPSPLCKPVEGWSEGKRVDAVVGEALVQAGYLRHVAPHKPSEAELDKQAARAISATGNARTPAVHPALMQAGRSLFRGAGRLYASHQITRTFPGYAGYLAQERAYAHRDEVRDELAAMVEAALAKDPGHLTAAVISALWRTMEPNIPLGVKLPPKMEEVVGAVVRDLRDAARSAASGEEVASAAALAMERLAGFCLEHDDEAERPWEDEAYEADCDILEAARALHLGGQTVPDQRLNPGLAADVDLLVEYSFGKDESESEFYNVGKGTGAARPPVYSIRSIPAPAGYRGSLERVRPLIARTRAALTFRNEQELLNELALRRGMVDEGALHKIVFGDPRLFARREIAAAPRVHLGVLVDESGSMQNRATRHTTRADLARDSTILLAEAVTGLRGVRLSVWGHTANTTFTEDGVLVARYLGPSLPGGGQKENLGGIGARSNNADGWALAYVAKEMLTVSTEGENMILLVLTDGIPSAFGPEGTPYDGPEAEAHVAAVANLARRRGIEVFCLGMGSDLSEENLKAQYGHGNYIHVPNIEHLPQVVSRLLTHALRKGRITR